MSRFAKVNLLEVEDSVAGRVEGLEGRFGRKHLDSRDLGVSLFSVRRESAQPDGSQPQGAGGGLRKAPDNRHEDGDERALR